MIVQIQWNYFGANRHAVLFFQGAELALALPVGKEKAEVLVKAGCNHGT